MSRASSRSASMRPTRPAIAGFGARSNASTARNSSSSAGPSRKEGGLISAPCCSGYYDPDGRLIYAGRVGSGIDNAELERRWRRLQPLATDRMPPPPKEVRREMPRIEPGA